MFKEWQFLPTSQILNSTFFWPFSNSVIPPWHQQFYITHLNMKQYKRFDLKKQVKWKQAYLSVEKQVLYPEISLPHDQAYHSAASSSKQFLEFLEQEPIYFKGLLRVINLYLYWWISSNPQYWCPCLHTGLYKNRSKLRRWENAIKSSFQLCTTPGLHRSKVHLGVRVGVIK